MLAVALAGCGRSTPPKHYVLHAGAVANKVAGLDGVSIGIGPVAFPEYLQRTEIVRRAGKTRLSLWANHQWAESPAVNFTALLADNVGELTGTTKIFLYPWDSTVTPDVAISARVIRFDSDTQGNVRLRVSWSVARAGAPPVMRRTQYRETAKASSPASVMEAMSRTAFAFSKDVVAAMASLERGAPIAARQP